MFISSSMVREIASLGGDVSASWAPLGYAAINEKISAKLIYHDGVSTMALMITDECINCDVCLGRECRTRRFPRAMNLRD